jgi:hypothetical protein
MEGKSPKEAVAGGKTPMMINVPAVVSGLTSIGIFHLSGIQPMGLEAVVIRVAIRTVGP